MKKCPYCSTLNNDENQTCVNCLHDISLVNSMPVSFSDKVSSYIYMVIFGVIMCLGGIIAMFSQISVRESYLESIQKLDPSDSKYQSFYQAIAKVDFEIEVMIITAILGVVLTIIGLYFVIRKYLKDRKVKNEKNK